MKISAGQGINNQLNLDDVKLQTQRFANEVEQALNNGLSFTDNFKSQNLNISFLATNTDTKFSHKLGSIPVGYLVIGKDSSFDIYNGSSDVFTKTFITLRATAISSATIIVF